MIVMSKRLQINVRLDGRQDLYDAIKEEAHIRGKSVSSFIIDALEKAVGVSPQQQQEVVLSQEVVDFLEGKVEEVVVSKLSKVVFKAG